MSTMMYVVAIAIGLLIGFILISLPVPGEEQ